MTWGGMGIGRVGWLGCAGGGSSCADDNAGDRRSRQVLPEPRRRVPRRFRALPAPLYRNSYAGTPSVPLYRTASALLVDSNVIAIPCKNVHRRPFLNVCYPESTYTPRVMLRCSSRVRPAHGSTSTTTCGVLRQLILHFPSQIRFHSAPTLFCNFFAHSRHLTLLLYGADGPEAAGGRQRHVLGGRRAA
jgi:hypothetical protein